MEEINTHNSWFDKLKSKIIRKKAQSELSETFDAQAELKKCREKWKENIGLLSNNDKEKIIKAADEILVKVEMTSDGSRLINFTLNGKKYKILDPKLKTHSDDEYTGDPDELSVIHINDSTVLARGMRGNDVEKWENQKLKEYVKQKQGEGLHIADIEEIRNIFDGLGNLADLDHQSTKMAMFMYLTGMDGKYYLSMGDSRSSGLGNTRSEMFAHYCSRGFDAVSTDFGKRGSSLCMISVE